jgi:hypothetical protein
MIVGFGELLFGVEANQSIDSKHYKRKKGLKIEKREFIILFFSN